MTHCLEIIMALKKLTAYDVNQIIATYQGMGGVVTDKHDGQQYRIIVTPYNAPVKKSYNNSGNCECGRGPMMDGVECCQKCYEESEGALALQSEAFRDLERSTSVKNRA